MDYVYYYQELIMCLSPFYLAALSCFYPTCLAGNPCTGSKYNMPLSFYIFFSISSIIIIIIFSFSFFFFRAFIFFSSTIPKELVNHIKSDSSVLPRIGALREVFLFYAIIPSLFTYSFIAFWFLNFLLLSIQMNMEYFPIDNQV